MFPRNQARWSINNEILFSRYKVKGTHEDCRGASEYATASTEIGYSYLKVNNLIRFKYPIRNLFLFFNSGISNGFAISETNSLQGEFRSASASRSVRDVALKDARKYEQGLIFGSGVKYDRFSLEARYERGNGMSQYLNLRSLTERYYLLLGYRF